MQPNYDDLDDLEEGGFNWMLVTVLLLAVGGFFSLAWYAYQTGSKGTQSDEVLVIKADPAPMREKPLDEGGREFAHQEKTIYDAVKEGTDGSVEIQLKPEADDPDLTPEPVMADDPIPADQKVAEILQRAVKEVQAEQPAAAAPAPEAKVTPVVVAEKPKEVAKPTPAPAEKPKAPAAKPAAPAPLATSGERVQLGAFRSRAEAEKQWQKLQKTSADVLGGKPYQVVEANLGEKGIYYRLRAAGFNSSADAKAACSAITGRGQPCLVVR